MSDRGLTVVQLLRQVWWLRIRVSAGLLSPMLRRWLERIGPRTPMGLQPRQLDEPHPANPSIAEQLAALPPGGLVIVPAFFVGKSTSMVGGYHTLWPLTQYFYTSARAERAQRQLARHFPGCVVLSVALTFDPAIPDQLANVHECRRRTVAEMLCAR
jgi:hypothetical protein